MPAMFDNRDQMACATLSGATLFSRAQDGALQVRQVTLCACFQLHNYQYSTIHMNRNLYLLSHSPKTEYSIRQSECVEMCLHSGVIAGGWLRFVTYIPMIRKGKDQVVLSVA